MSGFSKDRLKRSEANLDVKFDALCWLHIALAPQYRDIRYRISRIGRRTRVMILAYPKDRTDTISVIAWADCAAYQKDTFNKRLGRLIAKGRAVENMRRALNSSFDIAIPRKWDVKVIERMISEVKKTQTVKVKKRRKR